MATSAMTAADSLQGIELLRELDSILDFAKSTIQLELILYLGMLKRGAKAKELATRLGIRSKSVYDALTKLMIKGLVTKDGNGRYVLTDDGERFVEKVMRLLRPSDKSLIASHRKQSTEVLNQVTHYLPGSKIVRNLLTYKYIYEALLMLGLTEEREMSINELALRLGVTPATLSSYLDVAVARRGELGLFKKISKSRGNGRTEVFYRLTEAGLQEVSRFAEYRRIRSNRLLLTLLRVTKSYNVWSAYSKICIPLSILTGLSSMAYTLTSLHPLLWVVSALLTLLLSLTILFSRLAGMLSQCRM